MKPKELIETGKSTVERLRKEVPAVDIAADAIEEDLEIGGPLISGAVAFRLFLWLLPVTLISVVGLGLLSDAAGSSPESITRTAGVRGIAAASVDQATSASNQGRWLMLGVGAIAVASTSAALAKVLWRSHELAWRLPRGKSPSVPRAVAAVLLLTVLTFGAGAVASRLREQSPVTGAGAIVFLMLVWGALWLGASVLMPHGDAPWTALIPGAILVSVSSELLRVMTVYYVANKVGSSSAIYGGLGSAATMLTWFYLLGRATVGSAVLNATLWERRQRQAASPHAGDDHRGQPTVVGG